MKRYGGVFDAYLRCEPLFVPCRSATVLKVAISIGLSVVDVCFKTQFIKIDPKW